MNADLRKMREMERSKDAAAWNYHTARPKYARQQAATQRPYLIDSDGVPPRDGEEL